MAPFRDFFRGLGGVLVAGGILVAASAQAGGWHAGNELICSDCHTMHNSSAGQPMRYDQSSAPAPRLLRHATSLSLCIYCHDGSVLEAPDVVDPVAYVPNPNGGWFSATPDLPSERGHDVGMVSPVTPPGGSVPVRLSCITCHEHHGNANYRNLRGDPTGQGNPPVEVRVDEAVKANGMNPAQVYVPGNVVYRSGMSAWCGTCHGAFHGKSPNEEGNLSPWFRHPLDQALSSAAHVDYPSWSGVIADRVRVQNPTDSNVPSADDQVFCLTCHQAHGSNQKAALIFADGLTQRSTCQQCHNQ